MGIHGVYRFVVLRVVAHAHVYRVYGPVNEAYVPAENPRTDSVYLATRISTGRILWSTFDGGWSGWTSAMRARPGSDMIILWAMFSFRAWYDSAGNSAYVNDTFTSRDPLDRPWPGQYMDKRPVAPLSEDRWWQLLTAGGMDTVLLSMNITTGEVLWLTQLGGLQHDVAISLLFVPETDSVIAGGFFQSATCYFRQPIPPCSRPFDRQHPEQCHEGTWGSALSRGLPSLLRRGEEGLWRFRLHEGDGFMAGFDAAAGGLLWTSRMGAASEGVIAGMSLYPPDNSLLVSGHFVATNGLGLYLEGDERPDSRAASRMAPGCTVAASNTHSGEAVLKWVTVKSFLQSDWFAIRIRTARTAECQPACDWCHIDHLGTPAPGVEAWPARGQREPSTGVVVPFYGPNSDFQPTSPVNSDNMPVRPVICDLCRAEQALPQGRRAGVCVRECAIEPHLSVVQHEFTTISACTVPRGYVELNWAGSTGSVYAALSLALLVVLFMSMCAACSRSSQKITERRFADDAQLAGRPADIRLRLADYLEAAELSWHRPILSHVVLTEWQEAVLGSDCCCRFSHLFFCPLMLQVRETRWTDPVLERMTQQSYLEVDEPLPSRPTTPSTETEPAADTPLDTDRAHPPAPVVSLRTINRSRRSRQKLQLWVPGMCCTSRFTTHVPAPNEHEHVKWARRMQIEQDVQQADPSDSLPRPRSLLSSLMGYPESLYRVNRNGETLVSSGVREPLLVYSEWCPPALRCSIPAPIWTAMQWSFYTGAGGLGAMVYALAAKQSIVGMWDASVDHSTDLDEVVYRAGDAGVWSIFATFLGVVVVAILPWLWEVALAVGIVTAELIRGLRCEVKHARRKLRHSHTTLQGKQWQWKRWGWHTPDAQVTYAPTAVVPDKESYHEDGMVYILAPDSTHVAARVLPIVRDDDASDEERKTSSREGASSPEEYTICDTPPARSRSPQLQRPEVETSSPGPMDRPAHMEEAGQIRFERQEIVHTFVYSNLPRSQQGQLDLPSESSDTSGMPSASPTLSDAASASPNPRDDQVSTFLGNRGRQNQVVDITEAIGSQMAEGGSSPQPIRVQDAAGGAIDRGTPDGKADTLGMESGWLDDVGPVETSMLTEATVELGSDTEEGGGESEIAIPAIQEHNEGSRPSDQPHLPNTAAELSSARGQDYNTIDSNTTASRQHHRARALQLVRSTNPHVSALELRARHSSHSAFGAVDAASSPVPAPGSSDTSLPCTPETAKPFQYWNAEAGSRESGSPAGSRSNSPRQSRPDSASQPPESTSLSTSSCWYTLWVLPAVALRFAAGVLGCVVMWMWRTTLVFLVGSVVLFAPSLTSHLHRFALADRFIPGPLATMHANRLQYKYVMLKHPSPLIHPSYCSL